MTNYLNEEEDKYSSEEKFSDEVPQVEIEVGSGEEWGTDEDDDDWGAEEVRVETDGNPDTVEEPTDREEPGEIPDSIEEPSTEEINAEVETEGPKGFKVLSFEDFIAKK